MITDARTPRFLWAEAVDTANFLTNRSSTRANGGSSLYLQLFGQVPDLSHLRIFGFLAYVQVPKERRIKLEDR